MKKYFLVSILIMFSMFFVVACGDSHDHVWGAWQDNHDGTTHSRKCKEDFLHIETEEHEFDNGEVLKQVSDLQNGEIKYTCVDCGYYKTTIVAPTGNHNFSLEQTDEDRIVRRVSSATSVYYKTCADCGAYGNEDFIFEETNLPDEYLEIEYLKSTGGQYIDTEYRASGDTHIIFKASYTENYSLYGGTPGFMNFTAESGTNLGYFYYDGYKTGASPKGDFAKSVHVYEQNRNVCLIDGEEYYRFSYSKEKDKNNLFLFGRNNNGQLDDSGGIIKLYYCQIYDNDVLIRDYVPVHNIETDEMGLYDLVSQTFFTNFHDLKSGNVVEESSLPSGFTETEYVQSTGTQFINTGVEWTNGSSLSYEVTIQFPSNANMMGSGHHRCVIGCSDGKLKIGDTYTDIDASEWHTVRCDWSAGDIGNFLQVLNYCDENYIGTFNADPYDNNPYLLFACCGWNDSTGIPPYTYDAVKISGSKFYKNGVKIRDFVPCIRELDGRAGFYDLVTNRFFTYIQGFDFGKEQNGSDLPSKYKQVEYIESNGNHYIDTGIDEEAVWEFDIQFTVNGKRQLMGYGGSGSEYFGVQTDGTYGVMLGHSYVKAGNRDIVIFDHEGVEKLIKVNDNIIMHLGNTKINNTFKLFALNDKLAFSCHARLYGAKSVINNVTVRDFIPCINMETGEVGLFDKITQEFFGNGYDDNDNQNTHFQGGDVAGHDFDNGVVLKEASYSQNGEVVYTCRVCGKQIHKYEEKYAHKIEFLTDDGVDHIKIFKDYDPNNYEKSLVCYSRNKNTYNYSKVNAIVICELVLKDGYNIANVVTNNEHVIFTALEDGRYLITNITGDLDITIETIISE